MRNFQLVNLEFEEKKKTNGQIYRYELGCETVGGTGGRVDIIEVFRIILERTISVHTRFQLIFLRTGAWKRS